MMSMRVRRNVVNNLYCESVGTLQVCLKDLIWAGLRRFEMFSTSSSNIHLIGAKQRFLLFYFGVNVGCIGFAGWNAPQHLPHPQQLSSASSSSYSNSAAKLLPYPLETYSILVMKYHF